MNQELPQGWDEERIKDTIDKYDRAAAEHRLVSGTLRKTPRYALVEVPKELLPAVRKLIAEHEKAHSKHA